MRSDKARAYIRLLTDFCETVSQQVSKEVHRLGSGAANLPAVREAVHKTLDVDRWRKRFAGEVKEEQDAFDTTLAAMITAAHTEINGR
jgi:hypothetical protein